MSLITRALKWIKQVIALKIYLLLLERLLDWLPATGSAEKAGAFLDAPDPEIILLSGENEAAAFDRSRLWNMKTDNDEQAPEKTENLGQSEAHD